MAYLSHSTKRFFSILLKEMSANPSLSEKDKMRIARAERDLERDPEIALVRKKMLDVLASIDPEMAFVSDDEIEHAVQSVLKMDDAPEREMYYNFLVEAVCHFRGCSKQEAHDVINGH